MTRKGFTLIELLAVIVILAVIALIATPIILNLIEKARVGAAESSAYAYVEAAEKAAVVHLMENSKEKITGACTANKTSLSCTEVGEEGITLTLDIKGDLPTGGTVTFGDDGRVTKADLLTIGSYTIDYTEIGGAKQHTA